MINILEKFDDPYIYGPLLKYEIDNLTINHRLVLLNDNYYIGVSKLIDNLSDRLILRF